MTRSERTYYVVFAAYNLSWATMGAVYPLFLLSRGMDLFEINAILAVFLFANFAFEVPTGAVADLFGRKVSFLLSCLVRAAAFALYFSVDTFTGFVVAEIVDALGSTLASGALDAWAIDGMREEGDHGPADRIFSRGKMLSHTAMIASGLLGGYVGQVDIAYPWIVGVMGFLVTAGIATVSMKRDLPVAGIHSSRGSDGVLVRLNPLPALRSQITGGLATVAGHRTLLYLCGLTGLLSFAYMPALQLWPAHMTALSGEGPWLMGWIWAALNLAGVLGSWVVPRMVARAGRPRVVLVVTLLRAVSLALAAGAGGFGKALVGLVGHSAGAGASDPLLGAWMNDHATARQRATLLSIQAMSFMLGGSAGLIVLGLTARFAGIPVAWAGAALALLGGVGLIWWVGAGEEAAGDPSGGALGTVTGAKES